MNKVILMGRLTKNPEIKYAGKDNDMAVARYTLAVNRKDEILRYNVHVINNTGFDIYALYASEPDVDNWEEDLLEYGIVYDGERVDIEFVITEEDLDWDFAIEDFEGNVLEFYGLSFAECDVEGATLILEYDGYKGTASLY